MLPLLFALSLGAPPSVDTVDWSFVNPTLPWMFPTKPVVKSPAPRAVPAAPLSYDAATLRSKSTGVPLLVWVATPDGAAIDGTITIHVERPLASWWPARGAVVSVWLGDSHLGRAVDGSVTPEVVRALVAQIRNDGVPK